ncbi:MAG: SRPBCC family protein [Actinobacteria bacterium]|nr:MAG: SRPBCC family protein [Actinomycetota bacterium]
MKTRKGSRPHIGFAGGTTPRTIDESIEVSVPVSTAYNQWTQFEDFPLFMEGVDHVQQLDDTLLHWAATVAGKTNEWNAKILEQHPDRQISWISEDGKKTRGTVTFEPVGENKSRVRLSMSYQADPLEAIGSTAGLDARRVRGDLERFKELIESRGSETGAWRGEDSAGQKKS